MHKLLILSFVLLPYAVFAETAKTLHASKSDVTSSILDNCKAKNLQPIQQSKRNIVCAESTFYLSKDGNKTYLKARGENSELITDAVIDTLSQEWSPKPFNQ